MWQFVNFLQALPNGDSRWSFRLTPDFPFTDTRLFNAADTRDTPLKQNCTYVKLTSIVDTSTKNTTGWLWDFTSNERVRLAEQCGEEERRIDADDDSRATHNHYHSQRQVFTFMQMMKRPLQRRMFSMDHYWQKENDTYIICWQPHHNPSTTQPRSSYVEAQSTGYVIVEPLQPPPTTPSQESRAANPAPRTPPGSSAALLKRGKFSSRKIGTEVSAISAVDELTTTSDPLKTQCKITVFLEVDFRHPPSLPVSYRQVNALAHLSHFYQLQKSFSRDAEIDDLATQHMTGVMSHATPDAKGNVKDGPNREHYDPATVKQFDDTNKVFDNIPDEDYYTYTKNTDYNLKSVQLAFPHMAKEEGSRDSSEDTQNSLLRKSLSPANGNGGTSLKVIGKLETVVDSTMEECAAWIFLLGSRARTLDAFRHSTITLRERVSSRVNNHIMIERSVYDLNMPGFSKREFLSSWTWKWETRDKLVITQSPYTDDAIPVAEDCVRGELKSRYVLRRKEKVQMQLNSFAVRANSIADAVPSGLISNDVSDADKTQLQYCAEFDLSRTLGVGSRFIFEMRVNAVVSQITTLRNRFSRDVAIDAARRARVLAKATTLALRNAKYTAEEKELLKQGNELLKSLSSSNDLLVAEVDTQRTSSQIAQTSIATDRKTKRHIVGMHEQLTGHTVTAVRSDIMSVFAFIWCYDSRALNGNDFISRRTVEEQSIHNKTVLIEKKLHNFKSREFVQRMIFKGGGERDGKTGNSNSRAENSGRDFHSLMGKEIADSGPAHMFIVNFPTEHESIKPVEESHRFRTLRERSNDYRGSRRSAGGRSTAEGGGKNFVKQFGLRKGGQDEVRYRRAKYYSIIKLTRQSPDVTKLEHVFKYDFGSHPLAYHIHRAIVVQHLTFAIDVQQYVRERSEHITLRRACPGPLPLTCERTSY